MPKILDDMLEEFDDLLFVELGDVYPHTLNRDFIRRVWSEALRHGAETAMSSYRLASCGHKPDEAQEDGDARCRPCHLSEEAANVEYFSRKSSSTQLDMGVNLAVDEIRASLLAEADKNL